MSLKSSYMVWNRVISTGKLFDAMYPFVISDDALMLIE